jgi:hypothetical protein
VGPGLAIALEKDVVIGLVRSVSLFSDGEFQCPEGSVEVYKFVEAGQSHLGSIH